MGRNSMEMITRQVRQDRQAMSHLILMYYLTETNLSILSTLSENKRYCNNNVTVWGVFS